MSGVQVAAMFEDKGSPFRSSNSAPVQYYAAASSPTSCDKGDGGKR